MPGVPNNKLANNTLDAGLYKSREDQFPTRASRDVPILRYIRLHQASDVSLFLSFFAKTPLEDYHQVCQVIVLYDRLHLLVLSRPAKFG